MILVPHETLEKLNLKHFGTKQARIDLSLHDTRKTVHIH